MAGIFIGPNQATCHLTIWTLHVSFSREVNSLITQLTQTPEMVLILTNNEGLIYQSGSQAGNPLVAVEGCRSLVEERLQ